MRAHASVSVSDLPHIAGTPLAEDNSWQILDVAQSEEIIQWVWLQRDSTSAFIVYPSNSEILLPDNSTAPANTDQLTLRFSGAEEEYTFTHFGDGLITLVGSEVEVRYGINQSAAAGDMYLQGDEVHLHGDLILDGNLDIVAHNVLGIYGNLDLTHHYFSAIASANLILGTVKSAEGVLNVCQPNSQYSSLNIGVSLGQKTCVGDFVVPQANPVQTQSVEKSAKSSGGSAGWWFVLLLSLVVGVRFRNPRDHQIHFWSYPYTLLNNLCIQNSISSTPSNNACIWHLWPGYLKVFWCDSVLSMTVNDHTK